MWWFHNYHSVLVTLILLAKGCLVGCTLGRSVTVVKVLTSYLNLQYLSSLICDFSASCRTSDLCFPMHTSACNIVNNLLVRATNSCEIKLLQSQWNVFVEHPLVFVSCIQFCKHDLVMYSFWLWVLNISTHLDLVKSFLCGIDCWPKVWPRSQIDLQQKPAWHPLFG